MIEFIGVLAVLAILAAVLVPVIIKRVDFAAWKAESSSLAAMKDALIQYVLHSNTIPDQTIGSSGWAAAMSSEMGLAPANIITTRRGYARAFFIDGSGWLGAAALPYSQQPGGLTAAPTNARVMIVSTIAKDLPLTNAVLSAAAFSDIWNTRQGSKPGLAPWTTWAGSGADLLIQRINLEPLFHRVLLVNGYIGGQGYFSITDGTQSTGPMPIPLGGAGTNTYYLDGTVLGLCDTNMNLVAREVIRTDMSRIFEFGMWQNQLNLGVTNHPPLSVIATTFYTDNAPPYPWPGGSPKQMLAALSSYMDGYATWAGMSPCFGYPATNSPAVDQFLPFVQMSSGIAVFTKTTRVP